MTRNGQPIWTIHLKHRLETGIEIEEGIPGLIAPYYEICACHAAGYAFFTSWRELDWQERAVLVAHYFIQRLIANHASDAEIDQIKKQQAKGRKGRKK